MMDLYIFTIIKIITAIKNGELAKLIKFIEENHFKLKNKILIYP